MSAVIPISKFVRESQSGRARSHVRIARTLPSLTSKIAKAIKQCLATDEQKQYLTYLTKRRIARVCGQPMPQPEPLRLSAAERKRFAI